MNKTLNNKNNTPVQQKKISKTKLRKLSNDSPMLKILERGSYNIYNEAEGVYHIYTLEAGYQRGLYDMVNNCAQSTSSVVVYYLDHSNTGTFRIYNALENTCRTMHFHGELVCEAIEYLFNIKFTTEAVPLKPTKDKVFEERMQQSKTKFESFRSFHDHLLLDDNFTVLELNAATFDALKAGITHIKYLDHEFKQASWLNLREQPHKDGVYKQLWSGDEGLIMYRLYLMNKGELSEQCTFYLSYDESLLNSDDYEGVNNEQLMQKLKPLCRKDSIDNILAG